MKFEKTPLLFLKRLLTFEWKQKMKFGDTVLVSDYVATLSPNLSQNGWKLAERELKMCAQFLEKLVWRKKAKYDLETFSGLDYEQSLRSGIVERNEQASESTQK